MSNPFVGHELPSPALDDALAGQVLRDLFGLTGRLTTLGSHQDQNWRVDTRAGRFVLKVSNPGFRRSGLEAQNAAMLHLAAGAVGFDVPVPQPSSDGTLIPTWEHGGQIHDVRLVSYLEGRPLADFDYLAPSVLRRHGELAARTAVALADFDHPGVDRILQWDSRHAFDVIDALLSHVADLDERTLIRSVAETAREALDALSPRLRMQVVHADVTDVNVVAQVDRAGRPVPTGLIDFGDMSRTWVASDVATAAVGLLVHDAQRPLQLVREVVLGYHGVMPLTADEVDALWPLALARAAVCQVSSEQQVVLDPDSEYARMSLRMDRTNLHAAASVPIALAGAALREAAGLPSADLGRRTMASTRRWGAVLPGEATLTPLDLSTTSDLLGPGDWQDADAVRRAIASATGDGIAVGRHGEGRLLDTVEDCATEPRTVHLGVDLFAPFGTPVLAPASGVVVHVPPITIQVDGQWLRLSGVNASVVVGDAVEAGAVVGMVAEPTGLLPPHVHVQWLPPGVDAPDACEPSLAAGWLALCPDPGPELGVSSEQQPGDPVGLMRRRDAVVAGVQEHYFTSPPEIERGWRHHLYDTDGRAYLDMVNNVAVLGHSHPALESAVARQLRMLNTNSRFHYGVIVEFAERLAARLPESLDTVFLVSTGSEAVDLAIRIARAATGNEHFIAVRSAYHGWTFASDAISTSLADNPRALETRPEWVHVVESPNTYRGIHRGTDAGARYADSVAHAVADVATAGAGVAAFIAEPLYGNAGGVLLPDGYLSAAYASVRAAGGLCIADEVQVGYGRTGHHFWAFEQQGEVPDIVTVAKAAGNGIAVGAVVTRRDIADAFASQGSFFSSVGGSPLSALAGLTVLDVIEREHLQENARDVGDHLHGRLWALMDRHAMIGAVHGLGLYQGVELVRDRETREPATEEAWAICDRLLELGVLAQPTSDHYNVLKVKPPLCLTRASADFFVDTLDHVLSTGW